MLDIKWRLGRAYWAQTQQTNTLKFLLIWWDAFHSSLSLPSKGISNIASYLEGLHLLFFKKINPTKKQREVHHVMPKFTHVKPKIHKDNIMHNFYCASPPRIFRLDFWKARVFRQGLSGGVILRDKFGNSHTWTSHIHNVHALTFFLFSSKIYSIFWQFQLISLGPW